MNFYVVETRPNKYGHTHYLKVNYHENTFSSGVDGKVEKRLDEICDILADSFIDTCTQEYDWYYKDENLFSFWLDEIGAQCGYWEECYTIGDGKVYRDYTKEIGA